MKLYFAYGSHMDRSRMREICMQSRRAGSARLYDWRWIIGADGYANIVPSAGEYVSGVLFEIGYDDETALDSLEETATSKHRKRSLPLLFNSRTLIALCYANDDVTEGMASEAYSRQMVAACADAGIGKEYRERNISRFLPAIAA